VIAVNSDTSF